MFIYIPAATENPSLFKAVMCTWDLSGQDRDETRDTEDWDETETLHILFETRPRRDVLDPRRDIWHIKIIQHNKIRINWT